MADVHKQLADAMAGDERAVQANLDAAQAHYKAAATIANKMGEWAQPSEPEAQAMAGYDKPKATASQVIAASKAATVASLEAQKLSQMNDDDEVYIGGSLSLGLHDPYGDVIAKGGRGSGRYPAGSDSQRQAVIDGLRALANSAKTANEKSRLKTDVLGVSGPRTPNRRVALASTPRYRESQTDNAKDHNRRIASRAEALASSIECNPTKSLEEHFAELQETITKLRRDANWNSMVDNYDTSNAIDRSANALEAVVRHATELASQTPSEAPAPRRASASPANVAAQNVLSDLESLLEDLRGVSPDATARLRGFVDTARQHYGNKY